MTALLLYVIKRKAKGLSYILECSDEVIFKKQDLDRFVPRDDFIDKIPDAIAGNDVV